VANSELALESSKHAKMLKMQEDINKEQKQVIDDLKNEIRRLRTEYEQKLSDEARLLDIKTDRIRKLEAQLNNFIYKRSKFYFLTFLIEIS
jgi:hypothetical protein